MKLTLNLTLVLLLFLFFLPFLSLSADNESNPHSQTVYQKDDIDDDRITTVSLTITDTRKKQSLDIEDYLFGVVSAEMPASYSEEALKAQAVAAYTYLKWISENADNSKNDPVEISDDPSKHQAFITKESLKEKWGKSYDIYRQKISQAIAGVSGEYLTYNGEAAMTVFHALSKGTTCSAKELWGTDIPYLTKVSAPGDRLSYNFSESKEYTKEEFISKLSEYYNNNSWSNPDEFFNKYKTDTDEYFLSCNLDSETVLASDLRYIFNLNSCNIKIYSNENSVILTADGKGHGVGMSQNSADYMARQGASYKEILDHFYKGTELVKE